MKVELEVNGEQLKDLNDNVKDFLLSLTDEQKIKLFQNYINQEMDSFRQRIDSYRYGSYIKYEYTDFGKQLIDGLQDKISQIISNDILNKEEIKELIEEHTEKILDRMESIVEKSIIKYITDNLFSSKEKIKDLISSEINKEMSMLRK